MKTDSKWFKNSFLRHLHPASMDPRRMSFTYTFCLGGIATALFVVLSVTGTLLLAHFVPTTSRAYQSVYDISHVIPFGWWIRSVHYWAGQAMVVVVVLHMCRVVYTGSYQPPRTFNWWVGCALLGLTLTVDFTGYLLRWDQETISAATVVAELIRRMPALGATLYGAITGGEGIGDIALLRFYILHCVVVPGGMGILMIYHYWRIRKDGGVSSPL